MDKCEILPDTLRLQDLNRPGYTPAGPYIPPLP